MLIMSFEEEVQAYKALSLKIKELEEQKKALGELILQQMTIPKAVVCDLLVHRYDRLSFRTSIEEARELSATKMEEVLDKTKLKELYQLGHLIPGVNPYSYIAVTGSGIC